jgi:two-component system cell cycle sensor histidine kinase PleC
MARTWSVPQRGSFAALCTLGARHDKPLKLRLAVGNRDAQRDSFLLISALLTAIGIAVVNVDSQSLATLLLVAGAGLAATVILFSDQSQRGEQGNAVADRATVSQTPAQFTELLSSPRPNPAADRAVWAKLTAHMSHELRTPLNAVLGFSELMSKEVFGPLGSSCYGDYARDIHASGRMLLKSAEDALAITALLTSPERKGPPQSCRLKSVLDDAQAFAQPDLALRSITVVSDIATDAEVIGDPQAMRQMLINLLGEASRNSRAGAVLHVRTRDTNDAVTLSIELQNGDVAETTQDDGFPMILARTLCELLSARLITAETPAGDRDWTVHFLAATQNDLFLHRA